MIINPYATIESVYKFPAPSKGIFAQEIRVKTSDGEVDTIATMKYYSNAKTLIGVEVMDAINVLCIEGFTESPYFINKYPSLPLSKCKLYGDVPVHTKL